MSEEFEVRGAHEDRLDEAAEREPKGWRASSRW